MTRYTEFAASVAGRHLRRIGQPRSLRRVVLRGPMAFVVRGGSSVVVAPRIELALRSGATARAEMDTVARTSSGVERVVRRTSRARRTIAIGTGVRGHAQRLLGSTERVEPGVLRLQAPSFVASPAGESRMPPRQAAAPVELVVARRAASPPPPPEPPAPDGWGGPRLPAQQAAPPPKVDVEALTDEVMRSIDGRLVAYRERTGRV